MRTAKIHIGCGVVVTGYLTPENEFGVCLTETILATLPEFEAVLVELAQEGAEEAENIVGDLAGLALVQILYDAYDIDFDEEDRRNELKLRSEMTRVKGGVLVHSVLEDLAGLSLVQLFHESFDLKFDKHDRQSELRRRVLNRGYFEDPSDEQLKKAIDYIK